MNTRRWLSLVTAVAIAGVVMFAVYLILVQRPGQVHEESLQPQIVMADGADSRDLMVGVAWYQEGWCVGQFQVKATETATAVLVGTVINRTDDSEACAGVGTVNNLAWADLTLATPVGSRAVVRARDGVELSYFALQASLACQDAIASETNPGAGMSVVLNQVALPTGKELHAGPSGELDPGARLFAKQGLYVASGASFELIVTSQVPGRTTVGWGSPATRTTDLRVSGCGTAGSEQRWLVFPGGYWVDQPGCVSVLVHLMPTDSSPPPQSGVSQQVVQVGVGAPCPGQAAPPPGT